MNQVTDNMISFLIVNWNGGEILKQCISSIEKNVDHAQIRKYEIIIVDNNSWDLDEKWLSSINNIKLFRNKRNLGFAVGTNQSVKYSKGDILFIMNNDIVLNDDSLKNLLDVLDTEEADAIVPKMIYPDGRLQYSVRGLPTISGIFLASLGLHLVLKKTDTWFLKHFDHNKQQLVEQPMFSALVLRKKIWNHVGDMDEKFPMLFNDVDWFFRFNKLGLKCLYIPTAIVKHVHGMSVNKNPYKKVLLSGKSMADYFIKHYSYSMIEQLFLYIIIFHVTIARLLREVFILFSKR